MEPRKPITDDPKAKKIHTPTEEKDEKDENEIVAEVEQIVEKDSFADREHKDKRRHDSPADISNPGTI